jgi:hypothetical protein
MVMTPEEGVTEPLFPSIVVIAPEALTVWKVGTELEPVEVNTYPDVLSPVEALWKAPVVVVPATMGA